MRLSAANMNLEEKVKSTSMLRRCNDDTPDLPDTSTDTPTTPHTSTPSASGCSDQLMFMTSSYPDSRMTCYEDGDQVEGMLDGPREETMVAPGTSCIFLSSGHTNMGFIMELFCQGDHWVVTLLET